MKRDRMTQIICTLGPASQTYEIIRTLAQAGMDVARLNFSHGDHAYHLKLIETIRAVNKKDGYDIKILQDLEGYRIRLGQMKRPVSLKADEKVTMAHVWKQGSKDIPLDLTDDYRILKKGMQVFVDDGMICLEVTSSTRDRVRLRVVQPGVLKSRKGVNIPDLKLRANILTEKDARDVEFGIEHKVDFLAQSFVRNRRDILKVRKLVSERLPAVRLYAKIENHQGVQHLDSIMASCHGIMIARGDLGVSLPIYKLPVIQKSIIRRCNKMKKFSITATQMLESMTEHTRPTRAEVSDVANAILDGTDYVMLSAETAAGTFPVESVKMMNQVIVYTEESLRLRY